MGTKKWLKLQNGSDIRGVALGGIKGEEVNLDKQVAHRLGLALALMLDRMGKGSKKVALGRDSRISGAALLSAFAGGLIDSGYEVLDCGLASTPAMFMVCIDPELEVRAGVMITASHLPFNRNGMKFFTREGGFDKSRIRELLELASETSPETADSGGKAEHFDYMSRYAAHLVEVIRKGAEDPDRPETPLAGMNIVVDAGNGAGGFFASLVLEPLGARVDGSQFLQPDGRFPNHVPNPEDRKAMESVCTRVLKEKADLGIIFDTDVDRSALVDDTGRAINRNDLIALISSIILEEHPGSIVVTDSITSAGLKAFIEEELHGVHHRFKRGYKNVINESIRLNAEGSESWLAIETSGHAALKENHFLDDGAYLVAKLLIQAARMRRQDRKLGDLLHSLKRPLEEAEYRLPLKIKDFAAYGQEVLGKLATEVEAVDGWEKETPNHEGIRVRCENEDEKGWFLLRLSLHDPLMPLNIESETAGGVMQIRQKLSRLLAGFMRLDSSALQ